MTNMTYWLVSLFVPQDLTGAIDKYIAYVEYRAQGIFIPDSVVILILVFLLFYLAYLYYKVW